MQTSSSSPQDSDQSASEPAPQQIVLPEIQTALTVIEQSPAYKIETDELTELKQDGLISDSELAELKASLNL